MLNDFKSRILSTVLIFVLAFLSGRLPAQDQNENRKGEHYLGILMTTGMASYREDLLIPLGFSGPRLSLNAVYTFVTDNNLFSVRLGIGLCHLENRYAHEAWTLMGDLRLSWLKPLIDFDRFGQFWGGICVPLQMNNLFFESWDDAHLYWLTSHSWGIASEWQKSFSEKSRMTLHIEIPVVGFVSRPPTYRYHKQEPLNHWTYSFTEPNRMLHFKTIDTYRSVFIQMMFERKMRRALLNLGIEFQYVYCEKPEEIRGMNTSLVISYQWRIGS